MIEKAIYELLTTDSIITGLIGTRVFPWPIPQGAASPSVCYMIEDKPSMYLDGGTGIEQCEVTIAALSDSLLTARNIGQEIKRVLNKYRGIVGGADIAHCLLRDGGNDYDEEARQHFVKQIYHITIIT